jgi:hypothetical protein
MAGRLEEFFIAGAEILGPPIHGADEIGIVQVGQSSASG